MKKILLLSLILCALGLTLGEKSYASDQYLPKGINYLDLNNIHVRTDGEPIGSTFNPIYIKKNVTYTLVMSSEFLGQYFDYLDYIVVRLYDDEDIMEAYMSFTTDFQHNRAYFEFSMNTNYLHIEDLPISQSANYEAILYEGTYVSFSGFHPYIHEDEIMSYEGYLPMDYDDLKSLETIQTYIDAKNHKLESIAYEVIEDNYSMSSKKPGLYHVLFSTTSNQITKPLFLEIQVFDLTAPMITVTEFLEIPLAQKWSLENIKTHISVSDNVDDITTDDLIIIEDTYSDATTVGSYHMVFKARDLSGNESTQRIDIALVDKKAPVITGPGVIYIYTSDEVMTVQEILSRFTVYDDVDGSNVNIHVANNTYLSHDMPGVYQFYMTSSDRQGNTTNFMLYIHVIENRGPSFSMSEHIMPTSTKETLTEEEIIDWFKSQALSQGHQVSHVSVKLNEYEGHETSKGSYYVYLNYDLDGETYMTRVLVEVEGTEKNHQSIYLMTGISIIAVGFLAFVVIKKKK